MLIRLLSFVSGIPALVYQVVWTREVSLLVGGQMEAISLVIVAFFGGLALGARALGDRVDRTISPLRAYGVFEILAGLLALGSISWLRMLGEALPAAGRHGLVPLAGVFLILPVTFLLGGTTPALLRASVKALETVPAHAGGLTGANTAGSVVGVVVAVWLIPEIGLHATMGAAASVALSLGVVAFLVGRRLECPDLGLAPHPRVDEVSSPAVFPLAVAFVAGIATLGFEVVSARMAGIQLGSSLYAWGAVLACTLLGLALGNLVFARRAAESRTAALDLARIEVAAAALIALGLLALAPDPTRPSLGLTVTSIAIVVCGVLPPTFAMGAAFPFLVRLFVKKPELGRAFGTIQAFNTAGGIVGALISSFYMVPAIGPVHAAAVFAGLNVLLAVALYLRGEALGRRTAEVSAAVALVTLLALVSLSPPVLPTSPRVIYIGHGRQATAAVLLYGDRRDLVVDGDPEASTAGAARATEEFLAILPVMLHPKPEHFLEVGLGSGTTFGTATRLPLERLECVEIAQSVLDAAPFFAPDNRNVTTTNDERITILQGDGRTHLLKRSRQFDVAVANTLHPWSLGATGLYSQEYFARLSGALRPGGIAAQWLPLGVIGEQHLAAILRSFYGAFEHGALFWGAGNGMLVGSDRPIAPLSNERFEALAPRVADALDRIGIGSAHASEQRRIADLAQIKSVLGEGEVLSDDRPVLEARTDQWDHSQARDGENELLVAIARAGRAADSKREAVSLWLESRAARSRGEVENADRLERLAEQLRFEPARRARRQRAYEDVRVHVEAGNDDVALVRLEAIATEAPEFADVWISLARIRQGKKQIPQALAALERVVALEPMRGEAWNLLAVLSWQCGDLERAREAFANAVKAAPYLPEALVGAGGFALGQRDLRTAQRMLERLEALEIYGPIPEAIALRERIAAQ
ncbi:MAG: tetratricopeptide repeat protein [bacterium]|nr:tetratricopeptide repeat protein [bacterium]